MCTALLPLGGYPIAVNKYIISQDYFIALFMRHPVSAAAKTYRIIFFMAPCSWCPPYRDSLHRLVPSTLNIVILLSSATYAHTRVSLVKTLNMFYLVIYWTQKVPNYFIFLCSIVLPPAGHSSNHEYHCWNLQDNRAVFRIFIALLRFSFNSPSYVSNIAASQPWRTRCYVTSCHSTRTARFWRPDTFLSALLPNIFN